MIIQFKLSLILAELVLNSILPAKAEPKIVHTKLSIFFRHQIFRNQIISDTTGFRKQFCPAFIPLLSPVCMAGKTETVGYTIVHTRRDWKRSKLPKSFELLSTFFYNYFCFDQHFQSFGPQFFLIIITCYQFILVLGQNCALPNCKRQLILN